MNQTIRYIDDVTELEEHCAALAGEPWLAMDTEFRREDTYFPQLCLMQVASASVILIIDPIEIKDLSALFALLVNSSIVKVFHAAKQDIEIFYHLSERIPEPLFDTQIAAMVLGGKDQIGYAALVEQALGEKLDKAATRTDWRNRPLHETQLQYAIDDVRFLGQVYLKQREQLVKLKRLHWVDEDCEALRSVNLYKPDPLTSWHRIKEARRLTPEQRAKLKELAAWREQYAIRVDKPRRWILKDEVLLDIASRSPSNKQALGLIKGVRQGDLARFGDELLTVIRRLNEDDLQVDKSFERAKKMEPEQEALVEALLDLVREKARAQGVISTLLATRKDVAALVRGGRSGSLMSGWRRELIGDELVARLARVS